MCSAAGVFPVAPGSQLKINAYLKVQKQGYHCQDHFHCGSTSVLPLRSVENKHSGPNKLLHFISTGIPHCMDENSTCCLIKRSFGKGTC